MLKQLENLIAPNTEHNYVVGYKNYKTPKAFHTTLVPVRLHKVSNKYSKSVHSSFRHFLSGNIKIKLDFLERFLLLPRI